MPFGVFGVALYFYEGLFSTFAFWFTPQNSSINLLLVIIMLLMVAFQMFVELSFYCRSIVDIPHEYVCFLLAHSLLYAL
jgi:hypothetical protein